MARALSQIFTQIRGSIGGDTFLANQHHQIIVRARTSPVDPSTTPQNQVRQAFSGAAVDWLASTQANRDLWDEYADSLTYPNPLGDQTLPGRLTFMGNIGFKRYIAARGFMLTSVLPDAPLAPGFLSLDPVSTAAPVAAGTGISVIVGNPNAEDIAVYFWRSRVFRPTRNTYKGPWVSSSMVELKLESLASGFVDFNAGADDNILFVYIRAIVDDGAKRVSQPVIVRGVISTTVIDSSRKRASGAASRVVPVKDLN